MRKEVSLAIIIGIILGAIILYGINLANQSTKSLPKVSQEFLTPTPTNEDEEIKDTSLNITSHFAHQVVFDNEITLTGKSLPNTYVAIIGGISEEIIQSDKMGIFTIKITLEAGENILEINQVNSKSTLDTFTFPITYSAKPIE